MTAAQILGGALAHLCGELLVQFPQTVPLDLTLTDQVLRLAEAGQH